METKTEYIEPKIAYNDVKYKRFNDSLDEGGEITIAGYSALPSYILSELDPLAYAEAYEEFNAQNFQELQDLVFNHYPSIIAYNYRRSEKSDDASDAIKKLLLLKDTWESIAFVIYAIVLGEIRYKSINIQGCRIFEKVVFSADRLLSNAIKTKIQNIKAIINYSVSNNLGLKCEEISLVLLEKLLKLQDIRNNISHHAMPTKEEAELELRSVTPLFKELLEETRFFENCEILRFENFSKSQFKCEVFKGHALNKEFEFHKFEKFKSYIMTLGEETIFIKWDQEVFSLSPFLHFKKDSKGHETYLSFFKGKKDEKYLFEPIKLRTEISFPHLDDRFNSEKNQLLSLIVPN